MPRDWYKRLESHLVKGLEGGNTSYTDQENGQEKKMYSSTMGDEEQARLMNKSSGDGADGNRAAPLLDPEAAFKLSKQQSMPPGPAAEG